MGKPAMAVQEMLDKKVDLSVLKHPGSYPDLHEKITRQLSVEIETEKNPNYIAISWESQVEAMEFFNEHGFLKTLDRVTTMRVKRGYYDDDEEA